MCGTNETDMHLSYKDLQLILDRNLHKNPNSCLFLLYKAKTEFINKNIDKSLEIFIQTHQHTSNIRELETITWYEMGLIYVLNLDYNVAYDCFIKFTSNSKWSFVFNAYLMILLNGCLNNFDKVEQILKAKVKLAQHKNPIEIYSLKRIEFLKKLTNKNSTSIYQFLCLELTYLWCYIPYAKKESMIKMLDGKFLFFLVLTVLLIVFVKIVLYMQTEKTVYPITALIEGTIRIELGNKEFAEQVC